MSVKLILSDLDGTLLTRDKTISPATLRALERATERGVQFVPASGRFFAGMPEAVRQLPFLRYVVEINGARVDDIVSGQAMYKAEMTAQQVLEVFSYLDELPVVYDCYKDCWGYMDADARARMDPFLTTFRMPQLVKDLRRPVTGLKQVIAREGWSVQRVQVFFKDMELLRHQRRAMAERFPQLTVTSANPTTLEVAAGTASKGQALAALCRHLGIDPADTMAFGDRDNDMDMLRTAGIGVAMGNAVDELKAAADYVTRTNDKDGIAHAIERFVLND